MAALASVLVCVLLVSQQCRLAETAAHWIVTEDGRIQAQVDSVFSMRRPYDLVAFMKQEERAVMLENLKKELLNRKDEIDKSEDRDTGLEQRFYRMEPDCIAAGKPLPEFDLYISTVLPLENKGIRQEEHIDFKAVPSTTPMPPDCTNVIDLDYSIHAFEHLEGMKDRKNLSGTAELGLKNAIPHRDNVDDYGHLIFEAMKKNKTSWVLFNMAAFYWRIKGDSNHVIECLRRALHFSPRMQKDVALISLANVLHRARYSNEAAIVVHAALDVSKELNVNHFTLGNIYAVLGEYNKSVICFENTLKIQPEFEAAAKRKHAVLCHAKLENALEAQHRSLQRTLNDLKDYQLKHDFWRQQSTKLEIEQVPSEVKFVQQSAFEQQKAQQATAEFEEYCHVADKNGQQLLVCTWGRKNAPRFDFAFSVEDHQGTDSTEENRDGGWQLDDKGKPDYSHPIHPPLYTREQGLKPLDSKHVSPDWPSKEECDRFLHKFPDPQNMSTVYLSPENKGFEVRALLTEAQNLKFGDEHPLPWYPPVCVPLLEIPEGSPATYDHIRSVEDRATIAFKSAEPFMRQTILDHVNDGLVTEEEVGQRILTALKQNINPSWILYNLAGLYWRVVGNNYHGIECIRRALYTVPDRYKDVPLVNLANMLYRLSRSDDAVRVLKDALAINDVEPISHYFFGNLLVATHNFTGAIWHYERALQSQLGMKEAFSALRAVKCQQKFHQSAQSAAVQEIAASSAGGQNCRQKVMYASSGQQTESRVICQTENGEEKCVIETRSHAKLQDCEGHCTQTCTITPIKLESCASDLSADFSSDDHNPEDPSQCMTTKDSSHQFPNRASHEEIIFGEDFANKLDEVSDYYEKRGMCQGDECSQFKVQQGSQKPHIKLDFVNGVLHQKLIFVQSPNDLHVEPDECVIFNDGSRSRGCSKPEFQSYLQELATSKDKQDMLNAIINSRIKFTSCSGKLQPKQTNSNDKKDISDPHLTEDGFTSESLVYLFQDNGQPTDSDLDLPDPRIHIGSRRHLAEPTFEICQKIPKVDFTHFTSTWLSVTAKNVSLQKHIDFGKVVRDDRVKPYCITEFSSHLAVDALLETGQDLEYGPEGGLKEVLQKLNKVVQSVELIGVRIASALRKNSTSWILANMAALYWRVEGHANHAINCLRLALTTAPPEMKDVALISLANILHKAGRINNAIVVTNMALEVSNKFVVSHFTMANLYAAKRQWDKASLFYESTLGLQATFQPAKDRLQTIQCMKVLQNLPHNKAP